MTTYKQVWDDEKLASLLGEFDELPPGPVSGGAHLSQDKLERFAPSFPRIMEMFWRKNPLGPMLKGAYWLCEPDLFAPVIEVLFRGDPNFAPDRTHAVAYSVFGRLVAWNEDHWGLEVDLLVGTVTCNGLAYPEKKDIADLHAISAIEGFRELADLDVEDENGKWLYNRVRKKLGATEYGECYGFFPTLPLGGAISLDTVRKVRAREHFLMLAQMQDFVLKDYLSRPIREIRHIGPQG